MSKKFLGLLSILVSSSMLVACNNGSKEESKEESQQYAIYELAKDAGFSGTYDEWLASIKGAPGADGKDGVSVSKVEKTETKGLVDTYTITFSDGSKTTFTITNGEKGEKGEPGIAGNPGEKGPQGEKGEDLMHVKHNITLDLRDGSAPYVIEAESLGEFLMKLVSYEPAIHVGMDDIITTIEFSNGKEIPFDVFLNLPDMTPYEFSKIDFFFEKDETVKLNTKSNIFKLNFVNDLTNAVESIELPIVEDNQIVYPLPTVNNDTENGKYFIGWQSSMGEDDLITTDTTDLYLNPDYHKKGVNELTLHACWFYNEDGYEVYELKDYAQIVYNNNEKEAVVIPDKTKNNKPITCAAYIGGQKIKSLEIPGSIQTIDNLILPELTDLVIKEGVESIGIYEGEIEIPYLPKLKNVTIPDSLKSIDLSHCSLLEKVTVPNVDNFIKKFDNYFENKAYINLPGDCEPYALYHNEAKVDDLVVPAGVYSLAPRQDSEPETHAKGIDNFAFNSITIGKDVEYLEADYCIPVDLAKISVDKDNPYYDSRNDCNSIIETKTDKLVVCLDTSKIPDTVKVIGSYSIFDLPDEKFTIPNVVSLENNAITLFNATEVIVPKSVYYMDFYSINVSETCKVKFEDTYLEALAKGFDPDFLGESVNKAENVIFDYKNENAEPGIPEIKIEQIQFRAPGLDNGNLHIYENQVINLKYYANLNNDELLFEAKVYDKQNPEVVLSEDYHNYINIVKDGTQNGYNVHVNKFDSSKVIEVNFKSKLNGEKVIATIRIYMEH